MFHLTKAAGLEDRLYRGAWAENKREGHGTQLFPNGYQYTGAWKNNMAHGPGLLRYTDGTVYEAEFEKNRLRQGVVRFPNGAVYSGTFQNDEKLKERFLEGTISFSDGDSLKGKWLNGTFLIGTFTSKDGSLTTVIDKGTFCPPTNSKLIIVGSAEIYEGGLVHVPNSKEKNSPLTANYDGKGFLFSSYPHHERFEYKKGQLEGRYICNYISGGYCYEGYYKGGVRIGEWEYTTVKGYEYKGKPDWSEGIVSLPFLSRDYFKGKTEIKFQNITLVSGVFNLEDNGKFKQMIVENMKSLSEIEALKNKKFDYDFTMKAIEQEAKEHDPILNGVTSFEYDNGMTFTGNFNLDFIYIHKRDLPKCLKWKQKEKRREVSNCFSFIFNKKRAKIVKISGSFEYEDGTIYTGTMVNGKREGKGTLLTKNREMKGIFVNDKLEGEVSVSSENESLVINFKENSPLENKVTIFYKNGANYEGPVIEFVPDGKGVLTFRDNLKLFADFKRGELNEECKENEMVIDGNKEKCSIKAINRNEYKVEVENGGKYVVDLGQKTLKKDE